MPARYHEFPNGICDVGLQKAPPYRQKTAVERGTQIGIVRRAGHPAQPFDFALG